MRIALVEDGQDELEFLQQTVQKHMPVTGTRADIIDKFYTVKEFLSGFKTGKYDLVLLGICLEDTAGIGIAKKIMETDNNVAVVFYTNNNGFAKESYGTDARYCLLKQFSEKNITTMFACLNLYKDSQDKDQSITLPDGQEILLRNIIYTEYFNHVITIYNKKGQNIKTRISHSKMEELLCCHQYFCCCSKGIIVNFHEVAGQEKNTFNMSNGSLISISRRRLKNVRDLYIKFSFHQITEKFKTPQM
ncbi:MAG: LytTR family DNA-binding domain-containing protein [Lachnospiraceae bacterium]|nr:LytTR family DNA-binding domain-containing protein [Lachnospiraceae bacterium]